MTPATDSLDASDLRHGLTEDLARRVIAEHGSMVTAACRRVLQDDAAAQDAAQEVFLTLARRAATLPADTLLGGWLYRTASHVSQKQLRTQQRRLHRETAAHTMNTLHPDEPEDSHWPELEPLLEEAMHSLPQARRDLVVHCYFLGRNQRQAAALLGWTDSKVSREMSAALESLRKWFVRRGLSISAAGLALACTNSAAQGAPVMGAGALAAAMTQAAAAPAGVLGALWTWFALNTGKTALACLTAVLALAVWHESTQSGGWLATEQQELAAPAVVASGTFPTVLDPPQSTQADSAKNFDSVWAAAGIHALDGDLDQQMQRVALEPVPAKKHAMMQEMGVRISRPRFDAVLAGVRMDMAQMMTLEGAQLWFRKS